jgi:hypothetical protein
MPEDAFLAAEREAARLNQLARWMQIRLNRDSQGRITAEATLTGVIPLDPKDLAGSMIREIHRRLDEFESQLDD